MFGCILHAYLILENVKPYFKCMGERKRDEEKKLIYVMKNARKKKFSYQ